MDLNLGVDLKFRGGAGRFSVKKNILTAIPLYLTVIIAKVGLVKSNSSRVDKLVSSFMLFLTFLVDEPYVRILMANLGVDLGFFSKGPKSRGGAKI